MVNRLVEQNLGISRWKVGRLTQLLFLAGSVLIYSVMSMAVANSLFVSHVGAEKLPIAFILIGLFSLPAYAIFSQVVDSYSRAKLFRYALFASIALAIGLRFLLDLEATPVYYILLIIVFFHWDFHNNILYPSLLTDYFTTLEYKKYAPFIGITQAVGTLLGGVLTAVLCQFITTRDLLLFLPIVFGIAIAQLIYLENSQRPLDKVKTETRVSIVEALKTFPDLVKRFPLVLFLASSSFVLVIIYITSEFLWFNIYGQHLSHEALTAFLGLMRIYISILSAIVLYVITRPLLQWLGVMRMNVIYPLTTLGSFIFLNLNFTLGSGILLHLNGDSLYKSINLPVHQLNYNAIPPEFLGRVRTISDGVIYSIGLTLAGVLLWICNSYLELEQIVWIGIVLSLILLLIRLPMGKFYAKGLEDTIGSGSIDLDDFNNYHIQLPPQSSVAIRKLLTDDDRYSQIKGLEMAAKIGNPSQFLPEIRAILPDASPDFHNSLVKLFRSTTDFKMLEHFATLLESENPVLRETALEILIANQYPIAEEKLNALMCDRHKEISLLATIALDRLHNKVSANERIFAFELPEKTAITLARVIGYTGDRDLVGTIEQILQSDNYRVKIKALEALTNLAQIDDRHLADLAVRELKNPSPMVRAGAFKVLEVTRCQGMLRYTAIGLEDLDPRVRDAAAKTLAAYGKEGLSLAKDSLSSSNREVVTAAIAAIARVKTKQASDILFEYLAADFQQLDLTRKWEQQIPKNDPNWQPLAIAIADYHQRLIQKVLYILSCLGHYKTVNTVNRILAVSDRRTLANAVEILASLSNRRFFLPVMPLLEDLVKSSEKPVYQVKSNNSPWLRAKGYKILLEALQSKDRWIRTGALIAISGIPYALIKDRDPFVKTVAREIFPPVDRCSLTTTSASMNRLLLLKNVALFKNLSLDELLQIDKAIESEQYLAGENIFTEASWGTHLYIVAEGKVRIVKEIDGEQTEIKILSGGQYFGEVTLFDDAPHWEGAIAVSDCTLLKLEKNRFISLITQRPHIILEICRFLSQRIRETDRFRSPRKFLPPSEDVKVESFPDNNSFSRSEVQSSK